MSSAAPMSAWQAALGLEAAGPAAPAWSTSRWFGHGGVALQPEDFRGRVLVLHAFQMLCPGCVQHALPQMQRLRRAFADGELALVGLHSVFEHHAAMTPVSLQAFLHEYRVDMPVGVDAHEGDDPIPLTMRRYGFQGTPSLVLIDRRGRIRRHTFGAEDDLHLGAAVAALLAEPA